MVFLALALRVAAAEEPSSTRAIKAAYDAGKVEFNLGHFDVALAHFEEAYRLKPFPEFLFNIAQCQRALKRFEEAMYSYKAYLRESRDLPLERRTRVEELVGEMQAAAAPPPRRRLEIQNSTDSPRFEAAPSTMPQARPETQLNQNVKVTHPHRAFVKRPWFWVAAIGAAGLIATGVALAVTFGTHDPRPTLGELK